MHEHRSVSAMGDAWVLCAYWRKISAVAALLRSRGGVGAAAIACYNQLISGAHGVSVQVCRPCCMLHHPIPLIVWPVDT